MDDMSQEETVTVIFEDPEVTMAFAELLEAVGLRTEIIADLNGFRGNQKIITEPKFYQQLDPESQSKCLLVGNRLAIEQASGCSLSRPLTEEKVERALTAFIAL